MVTLHLIATLFMAGVIVFVQIVHYPLMDGVGEDRFAAYEKRHTVRTGWVVMPAMVAELGTAVWLTAFPPVGVADAVPRLGLSLLGVIWISTAALQVPAHGRLSSGFDGATHRRLVLTNWLRTCAWIGRVPVALVLAGLL